MKFKVSVPATSANVGPGFDVMGIAFDLYNRFTFDTDVDCSRVTGGPDEFRNDDNLVLSTMRSVLARHGRAATPVHLHSETEIPLRGGLGSSSSCIVAGIMAANAIGGLDLGRDEMLRAAALIEGHPDNVAPAILGGFVSAIIEDEFVFWNQHRIDARLSFYALIPDHQVSTEEARAILPKSYSRSDCIYNMSRVPLLVEGLATANRQLIRAGCKDRIHQQYRLGLIPDGPAVFDRVGRDENAVAIYVSGAGPTLMVIVDHDDHSFASGIRPYLDGLSLRWTLRKMALENGGARLKML